ncbi:MAG: hypothetical protein ACI9WC_001791 [Arenicella sp.]|jgi:hypothetical protein
MKIVITKMVALVIAIVFLYSCGDGKTGSGSGGGGSPLAACAVNQILSNGLCSACAVNEVTVDNRCVACASNEINVNNMCMACGINEIIENNSCVACGVNQQVVNGFCENIVVASSPTASTPGSTPTPTPTPVLMCPANSTLIGSICQCALDYGAAIVAGGTPVDSGETGTSCTKYPGDSAHSAGARTPSSCVNCHSVQVGTL